MSNRFEREQLRLKADILKATISIANTEGWSAVSIRRIANEIEYSTTKVYELFKNKDHLVLELLRQGFDLLANKLEEAVQSQLNPKEQAVSFAKAYCQFAWENSAYYRIMYGMDGVPFGVEETWQEGMRIGEISKGVLSRLLPKCEDEVLNRYVYAMWGTLHGISSLYMAGRLYGEKEQAEGLAVEALLAMTKSEIGE